MLCGSAGGWLVVRNGSLPERERITGVASVTIRQPRVRDNRLAAGDLGSSNADTQSTNSTTASMPPEEFNQASPELKVWTRIRHLVWYYPRAGTGLVVANMAEDAACVVLG